MANAFCPVSASLRLLETALAGNGLRVPRARRIVEDLRLLILDVASSRAGDEHLATIDSLLLELNDFAHVPSIDELAAAVSLSLREHRETFVSHIETHNCAVGGCRNLVPAPCQMTCPAGIDIPSYVNLIAMGRDAEAIELIRRDNPFPWVCGLICTRPCELMCVRGRIDHPVSIKFLKAFSSEKALSDRLYHNPPKAPDTGHRVAIIGAGPAGLTAAYYLALKGYQVRVIESLPMAGGMTMVGIPRYRLPREVIDLEVGMLQELGVDFHFNTRFGSRITTDSLKEEGFEAFVFAIGAHSSYTLGIPGEETPNGVHSAVDFLRRVALGDHRSPGKNVIVIGGGNVAIDAARTAVRLGADNVTLAYRRTRHEMPADEEEVEQAEQEGVHLSFLTVPMEIVGDNDRVSALKCLRAKMVKREGSDRMSPVPVEGSEFFIPADAVIAAIGQQIETECLSSITDLQWSRRNTIVTKTVTMETSVPGVFAAGDAVTGPATVVEAIGGGKRAAQAIDRYFEGIPQPTLPPVPRRRARTEWLDIPATSRMTLRRPEMPLLNPERRRITFQQVELGYSENTTREEARRCLRCDICLRCGTCVRVCRDQMGIDALRLGYFDFDNPGPTDFRITAERCVLCGACAANCPNDAIRMEDRGNERILSLCGTILNRQPLIRCQSCDAVIGPARYLDFVQEKTRSVSRSHHDTAVRCNACVRKDAAHAKADNIALR